LRQGAGAHQEGAAPCDGLHDIPLRRRHRHGIGLAPVGCDVGKHIQAPEQRHSPGEESEYLGFVADVAHSMRRIGLAGSCRHSGPVDIDEQDTRANLGEQ